MKTDEEVRANLNDPVALEIIRGMRKDHLAPESLTRERQKKVAKYMDSFPLAAPSGACDPLFCERMLLVLRSWATYVVDHPSCFLNEDVYNRAYRILLDMEFLYIDTVDRNGKQP